MKNYLKKMFKLHEDPGTKRMKLSSLNHILLQKDDTI